MERQDQTYLLIGGSRGIGAAIAEHLVKQGATLLSVSRTRSDHGTWIEADIADVIGLAKVVEAVGDRTLDGLLYLGGIWENGAFTSDYDFLRSPDEETRKVLAVNLIAPIELVKSLRVNLARSANPRTLFIGALTAHPHAASPEVANTASKFGLMGAVEAMRLSLSRQGIAFTIINPGNVATQEVLLDIEEGRFEAQVPIPLSDLITAVNCALDMSPASEISVLDLAQRHPGS